MQTANVLEQAADETGMPATKLTPCITVPADRAEEAHEILDSALDQIAIRNIPVYNTRIEEECVDVPVDFPDPVK